MGKSFHSSLATINAICFTIANKVTLQLRSCVLWRKLTMSKLFPLLISCIGSTLSTQQRHSRNNRLLPCSRIPVMHLQSSLSQVSLQITSVCISRLVRQLTKCITTKKDTQRKKIISMTTIRRMSHINSLIRLNNNLKTKCNTSRRGHRHNRKTTGTLMRRENSIKGNDLS